MMWIDILTLQQARRYLPVSMEPPAAMKVGACTLKGIFVNGVHEICAWYASFRVFSLAVGFSITAPKEKTGRGRNTDGGGRGGKFHAELRGLIDDHK